MRADNLYLSRLRVSDFRAFGLVDLMIEPSPGVVVLEGPNGLGKTTWFEAVEIALTGKVHRWLDLNDRQNLDLSLAVKRRRSREESVCSAQVTFSPEHEGAPFSSSWQEGTPVEPAMYLCSNPEGWGITREGLSGFLRGTHFLPQSPHLRILHLSKENRWNQILKNVAGYSEIDSVADRLQSCKKPLSDLVNGRTDTRDKTLEERKAWAERCVELEARLSALEADGVVPPPAAASRLALVDGDAPGDWVETLESGTKMLTLLGERLTTLRSEATNILATIARLETMLDLPTDWASLQVQSQAAYVQVAARTSEQSLISAELEHIRAEEDALKSEATVLAERVSALEQRRDSAERLVEAAARIPMSEESLLKAKLEAEGCSQRSISATAAVATGQQLLSRRTKWEEESRTLEQGRTALGAARRAWVRVREIDSEMVDLRSRHDETAGLVAKQREELRGAEDRLQAEVLGKEAAARTLENARRAAGEVLSLVSSLASHLADTDHDCPLCMARYQNVGELRRRAADAQMARSPFLAELEEGLRVATDRVTDAEGTVRELGASLAARTSALAEFQQAASDRHKEADVLRSELAGIPPGEEERTLDKWNLEIELSERALAEDGASELPASVLLRDKLNAAESERATVVRTVEAAAAEVRRLSGELLALQEEVQTMRKAFELTEHESLHDFATAANAALSGEQAVLVAARANLNAVAMKRNQKETQKSEVDRSLAEAVAIRARLIAQSARIEGEWVGEGLAVPPSAEGLNAQIGQLGLARRALAEKEGLLRPILDGVGRWVELSSLQHEVARETGGVDGRNRSSWAARTAELDKANAAAEAKVSVAQMARREVERLAQAASQKREEMRNELRRKLSPIFEPLCRLLISDEALSEVHLSFPEVRKKQQLDAQVGSEDYPLVSLASEGQLAGVNVALQLSMALAFRWSRWPAVLLDDPTQYSDVVHAANLIDTLRMFSVQRGFQIFISTHDHDFAKYVERKFMNEGVSATRILFTEPANIGEGIVPRVINKSC